MSKGKGVIQLFGQGNPKGPGEGKGQRAAPWVVATVVVN